MKKLVLLGYALFICTGAYAASESIVLTTYYPAPYGAYTSLLAKKIAVGDTDENGSLGESDLPKSDGQLYVARSVIFKPQTRLPKDNVKDGEMIYFNDGKNNNTAGLYYYNGKAWIAIAGSGMAISGDPSN